ncbi:MAG: hypothetical protein A3H97_23050 [Acidobacteria bacterium RIFCSPLOWO2_02_FULL_65_29]|nr:MAG: hypothetical protein A3H97_23050 [Acidobacteria bacterium RIFCSPLOWO2_02_FULL_65_29]
MILLLGALGLAAVSGWLDAAPPAKALDQASTARTSAADPRDRFVGTWKLVSTERVSANGERLPPTSTNQIGFLIYDSAGNMGVTIMQGGRQKYAGAQPTPEEARAALTSYTSYFGTFIVNAAEGVVTHRLQGSLNPGMATDQRRGFELKGNLLTLKPPRGANGVQSQLTWEREPDLKNLTATHRRLIGFWKLVSNERKRPNGELVSSNPGQAGFIIYTASGHMAVHLMQANRKPYAGAQATLEEARAALSTYGSYFGPYTVHEAERFVVHHQIGQMNPGQVGNDAQRFFELTGNRLILKPPPSTADGQPVQGYITWERVTPAMGSR